MRLPAALDPADFDERYRLDVDPWREAVREVCEAHGIAFQEPAPFADGSNLIAAVGQRVVVKIFPPFHRHQWESEHRVLAHLGGRVRVPIPELVASGVRDDGWTYVILGKLPGTTLERIWPACSLQEKADLLAHIGAMIAEVHSVPVGELAGLEPAWSGFLAKQAARCRARHERLGMPRWFVEGVETFVEEAMPLLPSTFAPVILTGEYTPFNLLVEQGEGRWGFSGMIDFGDSMVGFREYDLLGPCVFLAQGVPDLLRSLLRGHGYSDSELDESLRRRLMLLQVLHRYSNFRFQVRIDGWESRATSFEALEELMFSF
jgi:hygromycin-B 7''-O-kinase